MQDIMCRVQSVFLYMGDSAELIAQHIHVGQVADGAGGDARRIGDGLSHVAGVGVGEHEVVPVTCQVLTPYHHRVVGAYVGNPFGIDAGVLGQVSISKHEWHSGVGISVPAAKRISEPSGVFGYVVAQLVASLSGELRGF